MEKKMDPLVLEQYAECLEQHDDYRIIRRYQRPSSYSTDLSSQKTQQGLIIDLETTGLSSEEDKIIECALLPFKYTATGQILNILPHYNAFEDPKREIPLLIQELTGIRPEMVKDQSFDEAAIQKLVGESDLLIAHNAGFDRPFFEKRFPVCAHKAWGCSASQVPWKDFGIESAKLSFIAYRSGFFYEGHRALHDCEATLHALALNNSAFKQLLVKAFIPGVRLFAAGAPFAKKDLLRARGYRWNDGSNGHPKAWFIDIEESQKEEEVHYLHTHIMGNSYSTFPSYAINAHNRFSSQI
jgi:DNA polymerase III subunit epsilon